jgi:hypothetical protein
MQEAMFEVEYAAFEQVCTGMVEEHEGEYVVIRGTDVLGVYPTAVDAFEAGISKVGVDKPFLLERIAPRQRAPRAPRYINGFVDADPLR